MIKEIFRQIFLISESFDEDFKTVIFFGRKFVIKKSIIKLEKNYQKTLKRIRKKSRLKIAFLVNEKAKWKTQSLYNLLIKDFDVYIAVTPSHKKWQADKTTRIKEMDDLIEYFSSINIPCIKAYDTDKDKAIKKLDADIVFYQQPWGIEKNHSPEKVSNYALTCYVPYYVPNYGILKMDCQYFHKSLFRYYVLNEDWKNLYCDYIGKYSKNIVAAGHTMLDYFYLTKKPENHKNYVIYAPHWSVFHPKNPNDEYYSTFLENGKEILDYAKHHPEINWVFKPHPTLKSVLLQIGWSEEEISDYYNQWENFAKCSYDSDYMGLFNESKAMITDCGSFLMEYFCTGKPIIHLISQNCTAVPPKPAKKVFDTFYKVHDNNELFKILDDIIIKSEDKKELERLRILAEQKLLNNYAAKNILDDLKKVIYGK